jgi:hypothetical protein
MNIASYILQRPKPAMKQEIRRFIHPLVAPLSPPTPTHPVPAPRPGPTRPSTLKSNFLSAIGARFEQDAIYYVSSSTLFVGHCDHRRNLTPITQFSKRVDP